MQVPQLRQSMSYGPQIPEVKYLRFWTCERCERRHRYSVHNGQHIARVLVSTNLFKALQHCGHWPHSLSVQSYSVESLGRVGSLLAVLDKPRVGRE